MVVMLLPVVVRPLLMVMHGNTTVFYFLAACHAVHVVMQ
jgi:hypothetical protein